MSVHIPSGEVHGRVSDCAEQLTIICLLFPPPEDVVPELVTVEGSDEQI